MKPHPHSPNWTRWLGHLIGKPARGLEIGTWKGESAEWMLDSVFTHPESSYTCIDHFRGSVEHHIGGHDCSALERDARARLARFGERVEFLVGGAHEMLRLVTPGLDFGYVDGDHSARGVLHDAVHVFDLLKVGGVIVFDDYAWTVMPKEVDRPRIAVDAFARCYECQIEELGGAGWQKAFRKVAA